MNDKPLDDYIHVKIARPDKELVKAAAKRDKREYSDWVRFTLIEAAEKSK